DLRGSDDIDEKHCDMALFAAELDPVAFGGGGNLAPDMTTEQVAHPLSFPQTAHHRVETALQLTEFGAVEHHQVTLEIPLLDAFERCADHPHRGCGEPRQNPHQQKSEDQR